MPGCLEALVREVRRCTLCTDHLPLGPRPVLQAHTSARILVAGQAPGIRVHESGIPFNDPSGNRLREWMGISSEVFYDQTRIALLPMGFCYPGTGKSGDLPPRPECAEHWRQPLLGHLPNIRLTLVIGQYAHNWHLPDRHKTLTDSVRAWQEYLPAIFPLPHPSPRNNIWLKKNPWFSEELLPMLAHSVMEALNSP